MLRCTQEMAFQMESQKYSTLYKGKSTFIYTLKRLCEEFGYIVPKNILILSFCIEGIEPSPDFIGSPFFFFTMRYFFCGKNV